MRDIIKEVREGGVSEEDEWFDELPRLTPYDKLKHLYTRHLKTSRQGKWAKRWWDDEVSTQCKVVWKAGRGGKGPGEREKEGEYRRV